MIQSSNSQLAGIVFSVFLFSLSVYAQESVPSVGAVTIATAAAPQQGRPASETSGIREVAVKFQSGSVTLAGTILIPPGQQRHPAIVLTHGSGPGPRSGLRLFADRFVRDRLVVLLFDKRGSGESGGSWVTASLDDQADDAVAAANFLRSRDEVDSRRIGVWGGSHAGWVIPRALARSPGAFQFAIIITGGGVKPIEVERYDYAEAIDHLKVTAEQRRRAMSLVESYFEYLRTGIGLKALEAAIAAARSEPWFPAVDISRVLPKESFRDKWEWVATYDPVQDIQQIQIPVLVVFGGLDRPTLSALAQERWRNALMKAGNQDATELVFLNAGHGITVGGSHEVFLSGGMPKYAPGYLEVVDAWLKTHCGLN
jgi:pimeloyl-ACP methyl ester carboxylesterase